MSSIRQRDIAREARRSLAADERPHAKAPPRHDRVEHFPRPDERIRTDREARDAASGGDQQSARRKLDKYVDKLAAYLPGWLFRTVKWLRAPERILARVVVSLLLIIGAVFSFLPVLGIWMLPLGLIIISQDLVFLQRPLATSFAWIERRWRSWRAPR